MSSAREDGASPSVPGLRHAAARAVFPALTPPSATGGSESAPPPRKRRGRGKKKSRPQRAESEEIPLPEEPSEDEPPPPEEPPEGLPEEPAEDPVPEAAADEPGAYRRVAGQPRQGSDTLAWGASPRCEDCGVLVGGRQEVVLGPEGWCIATLCGCDQPWYTQESAAYDEADEAEAALESGDYELP